MPNPHETHEAIKTHLGGKIPCYGEQGGCVVDDPTNADYCDEGCLLLKVYNFGFDDGEAVAGRAAADRIRYLEARAERMLNGWGD